MLYCKKRQKMQ